MANQFHGLLASRTNDSLLKNLNLTENEHNSLVSAATEIRKVIIAGFNVLRDEAKRFKQDIDIPKPKFVIQGSFIYGTLNSPANPPKQQVDIDLGMYLPFSMLGDGQQPKTATTYYFDIVTSILETHIESNKKQWSLLPKEQQKDTCIRVILNAKTHIDIPLFAVPKDEFNNVTDDSMAINKQASDSISYSINEEIALESRQVEAVDPSVIHMAHRKKGWLPSDALVIRDWIKTNFKQKGSMIRATNRFLKAWRDIEWPDGGGPSSIFLLAHSIKYYPENPDGLNHCQVLHEVISSLSEAFNSPLLIPCPKPEDRFNKLDLRTTVTDTEKLFYKQKFESFNDQYNLAKEADISTANKILINLFGKRFPLDPSRIIVVRDESKTKVQQITSSKPDVYPLHTTDRSNSG